MRQVKYLILGAGPSGLSFAHALLDAGETSFVVLEKEKDPGGLCRSAEVDGAPLDIGGGHFLDVRNKEVLEFLFRFLPRSEWNEYSRISRINLNGLTVDYPLEANLWQLPVERQLDYLESIAQAGCVRGLEMPEAFEEWVYWKLGKRIAEDYMLPYNRKIWSLDLSKIGTYWLYKLPNVSFRETLLSCMQHKPSGSIPAHGTFFYPKQFGYGEVWNRMGAVLGDRLITDTPVERLDMDSLTVNDSFRADVIISTIPWPEIGRAAILPVHIQSAVSKLEAASVTIEYCPDTLASDAHWIYEPDEEKAYHRILCRHNFVPDSRGYWTETNTGRSLKSSNWKHVNLYAYPVNTVDKPEAVEEILDWGNQAGLVGIGRWGTWEHMNSDVSVASARAKASEMMRSRL